MKEIARLYKAFSDETRLRILHLLLKGEFCICDLMEVLELPQSKVSRHMAYLRNAGSSTTEGKLCGHTIHQLSLRTKCMRAS